MTDSTFRAMDDLATRLRKGEISRREFIVRSSALIAAGAVAGVPATGLAQSAEPKKGGFARFGMHNASQNDNLDPGTWSTSYTGSSFGGGIYNNLVEILPDGTAAGDLAESWEPSDAGRRWNVKLRDGVTFHNGKGLSVDDVRESLLHHMGENSSSGARAIVEQIEAIDGDGDNAVVFTLKEGNADFPYLLSDYHLPILPALEGGGIDTQTGVGTGAFTLESFEPGIATRLVRNPNYHKDNKPYFDEVEFISITDATARLNALLTGEVDMIQDVDIRTVPMVERSSDFRVQRTPSLRHFTFDMDPEVAPFNDPNVRLALKHAIDRDDIIEKVFLGEAKKGNDNPVAEIMKFYAATPPQYEYDIEKAKAYLAKAGLDSITVDLSVAENAFAGAIDAAVLYKEHAAPAGITINIVHEAADGYWENVWLKKPFAGVDWFGRATIDWLFATSYTSDAPWNVGWSNARFDELHALARAETDEAKRAAYYAEMQQIIHDDGNTITVAFVNWRNALSNRIGHGLVGGLMPCDNMRMAERWWVAE